MNFRKRTPGESSPFDSGINVECECVLQTMKLQK